MQVGLQDFLLTDPLVNLLAYLLLLGGKQSKKNDGNAKAVLITMRPVRTAREVPLLSYLCPWQIRSAITLSFSNVM